MRYLYSIVFCFLIMQVQAQKPVLQYTIAPWFDNKKAAVTLTFDDGIPGQYAIAVPLLDKYGFKGTFFMSPKIVDSQHIPWEAINKAALNGHEIANHALTHPHFIKISKSAIRQECVDATKVIDKLVTAQRVLTHAYPFGEGGGDTDTDRSVRQAVAPYFIGARATQNKPYSYNKYDFAKTNDDYYNVNSQMITDSPSMANFGKFIDETITVGGWFCPTYHGIQDGWIITPAAVFAQHLEELKKRKDQVWIAPFKDVIQYHKERNCATLKLISSNTQQWQLSLTDTLKNSKNWDQPLTINLSVTNRKVEWIEQGKSTLPYKTMGDVVVFNAIPGENAIIIRFKKGK